MIPSMIRVISVKGNPKNMIGNILGLPKQDL